jgi:hypothetical protein
MPDMSDSPQPSKPTEPTPEQLLKLVDVQIAATRARHAGRSRNRTVFAVVAVLVILFGALLALFVLQNMLTGLPRNAPATELPADLQKSP